MNPDPGISSALRGGKWVPTAGEVQLGAAWLALDIPVRPEPPRQAYRAAATIYHLTHAGDLVSATDRLLASTDVPEDSPMVRLLAGYAGTLRPTVHWATDAMARWEVAPVRWPAPDDPQIAQLPGWRSSSSGLAREQYRLWEHRMREWEGRNLPGVSEQLRTAMSAVAWVPGTVTAAATGHTAG